MNLRGKILKKILVVIIILIMIAGAGVILIRSWMISKMSPDMRALYDDWKSTPLHFNPADVEALPFHQSTKEAAMKFSEEWKKNEKTALALGNELSKYFKEEDIDSLDFESLREQLAQIDPMIQALVQLIEKEDYEIDALITDNDPQGMYGIPVPNFLQLQVSVKILGLKAYLFMNDEKTSEALKMAETMIKASKSHLYSTLISQLISIACYSIGSQTWYSVISRCDDPELIRSALERQNELAPHSGFIAPDINIMVLDNIGSIRIAQRYGISFDIEGKTGREISGEQLRVSAEFQEKIILPSISNQSNRQGMEKAISGNRKISAVFGAEDAGFESLGYKLASPIVCPMLFQISMPNFEEARTREKATLAKYDLLRLFTAKKLYFLEHQKEPENMEDLVPEYIPELLMDPFTEKEPYRKDTFFYSIGPDKIDQKGAVLYDPTNGTVSPGDIHFVPLNRINGLQK